MCALEKVALTSRMRTMWFLHLFSGQAQLLLTPAITFILECLSTGGQTPAVSLGPSTSEWHVWRGVEALCCLSTPRSGLLPSCGLWASHCGSLFCCRAQALERTLQ